jgi:S-adenosylmethionine:tRNA ribosyltransferase-isomerase
MKLSDININQYNYDLTDERIAKYPLSNRDDSKLLVYDNGSIMDIQFNKLHLEGSVSGTFVFNNTKVIRARLQFFKTTGAKIEIFCLEPIEPAEYNLNFQSRKSCKWKCTIGNLKKWKTGKLEKKITINGKTTILKADKILEFENSQIIQFSWDNYELSFSEILQNSGQTPIPPYLKRDSEKSDTKRYQTIYSEHKGSVAAPTAGLHFTDNVLKKLEKKGIHKEFITLHVGAGTFKPVKEDSILNHEMHTEHFSVDKEFLEDLSKHSSKITAVGTTSVRTIESLYHLGIKLKKNPNLRELHIDQWEVYESNEDITVEESVEQLLRYLKRTGNDTLHASTKIMIVPGYEFKFTDQLITNFHQPKSTLLLLIAAFIGNNWKDVYEYALQNEFRFLSYGDSSLLIP